jgi:O-antigen ligase
MQSEGKSKNLSIFHRAFLLWPAFLLVVPGAYFAAPFLLAISSLFIKRINDLKYYKYTTKTKKSLFWLFSGFAIYSLIFVLVGIYHGNNFSFFGKLIPFILFPLLSYLIIIKAWSAETWLISVALGSLLAFVFAFFQIFILDLPRAFGAHGNPIPFGNAAVVLASICLIAAINFPFTKHKFKLISVLLVGFLCGMGASLLSGSKGGWISLVSLGAVAALLLTTNKSNSHRIIMSILIIGLISIAGLLAPSHLVKDRLVSGIHGGLVWLKTGEVTEGSVSMRFEIWKFSYSLIKDKPFLGHGQNGVRTEWAELPLKGSVHPSLIELAKNNPNFRTADNEILDSLKAGGMFGLFALIALYFCVWRAFWIWRHDDDRGIRSLSIMGLLLVFIFIEFGLSVSSMGINLLRSVFASFSVALLAFIITRNNALRSP